MQLVILKLNINIIFILPTLILVFLAQCFILALCLVYLKFKCNKYSTLPLKLPIHLLIRQGREQSTVAFNCLEFPLNWINDNLWQNRNNTHFPNS